MYFLMLIIALYIYIYVCVCVCVCWLVGFYGQIYFYVDSQLYFKQSSLAWVHSLIVKNISISSYSV